MINIIVSGIGGRMGREVVKSVEKNENTSLLGGIRDIDSFSDKDIKNSVIIDFSSSEGLGKAVDTALKYNIPLVTGTTALTEDDFKKIEAASKKEAVFLSFNMSMGIFFLQKLFAENSKFLKENYDEQIIELHHKNKKDAPSGTAIKLSEALNGVPIQSVRMGAIKGCHRIIFADDNEVIEIKHTALDRSLFSDGAVNAALFIFSKKPGLYNMNDMFEGGNEK